ncbi:MAG: M12 family metallo-peptidase, partial [Candidatus Poribacteria bacterium]|nr:M12 family metallo-peptidase [Candidatus Poribacteria bacterium]
MKSLVRNHKCVVSALLTLLVILSLQCLIHEQAVEAQTLNAGEPRTVRMFYFLPNDRPYRQEVVDAMKTGIVEVQTFFADQMEIHGHGRKTFKIETDAQGTPIVHRVDGDHNDSHYSNKGGTEGEIGRAFDNSKNIILVVMDISGRTAHGRGAGSKSSGWAVVYGEWNWFAAAHELGHVFGLQHDFRNNAYILSYGRADRSSAQLSACAAEFLSVHPYFNANVPLEHESPPTIELISPTEYPSGSASVPIRLRVRDDDGLHQVFLFVTPEHPFLPRTAEVKACHKSEGETDAVVEFNFD